MRSDSSRFGAGAGPSPIEAISAVTLATHDMARAVRFYQALGFALCRGGAGASLSSVQVGAGFLNLVAQPAGRSWSWWGRADGCGNRPTGRLVGVGKDAVVRYAPRAGGHAR